MSQYADSYCASIWFNPTAPSVQCPVFCKNYNFLSVFTIIFFYEYLSTTLYFCKRQQNFKTCILYCTLYIHCTVNMKTLREHSVLYCVHTVW